MGTLPLHDWTKPTCPKMRINCWFFYCLFISQFFSFSISYRSDRKGVYEKKIPGSWRCVKKATHHIILRKNSDGNTECATKNGETCYYTDKIKDCRRFKPTQVLTCSGNSSQDPAWCNFDVEAGTRLKKRL